ncbi:hypothetical protein VP01_4141g2 [Puccinia sorghi]|uniref:MI domain-containing protein n=1 Tax=Puccinia sorghi TaxID=27349 RepID=A0A0L6UR24_9BASI|nr:hypothetical protein VP01_4141g2 [Puccinia sorghi]
MSTHRNYSSSPALPGKSKQSKLHERIVNFLTHPQERNYNPYYTMIGQKLASESRSIQITMQYLLWDFFRELGEKEVGGQEMLKSLNFDQDNMQQDYHNPNCNVDPKKLHHFAWAYGWWIAKGSLPITVLKPLPFGCLKQKTQEFLAILISLMFLSVHSSSPTLILSSSSTTSTPVTSSTKSAKVDSMLLTTTFKKILVNSTLSQSFLSFLVDENPQSGYNFYLNKLIKQPLCSNISSNRLDFFGTMVPQDRLVYFLNLITSSKSFVVDFLSDRL